jgi:hypothetical protein
VKQEMPLLSICRAQAFGDRDQEQERRLTVLRMMSYFFELLDGFIGGVEELYL